MKHPHLLVYAVLGFLSATSITEAKQPNTGKLFRLNSSRHSGAVDQVKAQMEVGGHLKELVSDEVQHAKLSVICKLVYDERTLKISQPSGKTTSSIRYYEKVDAVIKVEQDGLKPTLRDERRLIRAKADGNQVTIFSPSGPLTREELDLLKVPGDSLLLDQLLPDKPVAINQSWKHPKALLTAMLGLDEAAEVNVQSTLTSADGKIARMEITGVVEGAIGGISTSIELKGKYRFNQTTRRIDWFGILVRENRDIGHVADGIEAVARIQYQIAPKSSSPHLTDKALAKFKSQPTAKQTQLFCRSGGKDWYFTHDRNWHITSKQSDLTVLRLLNRGELLAQCNIMSPPKRPADKLLTLEQFQAEVKQALGDSFQEFVDARQSSNEAKYRVFRVRVHGVSQEIPIQWIYYLVADKHGHQAAFAFTVERSLVERLDGADKELVSALRFSPPQTAEADKPQRR